MDFEIIDFHTHPFIKPCNNICSHKDVVKMDKDSTLLVFEKLGVSKICGSVVDCVSGGDIWERVENNNKEAQKLKELYGDFYIPGFHIHADFVEKSLEVMKTMKKTAITLSVSLCRILISGKTGTIRKICRFCWTMPVKTT